jgi:hypothetical protein
MWELRVPAAVLLVEVLAPPANAGAPAECPDLLRGTNSGMMLITTPSALAPADAPVAAGLCKLPAMLLLDTPWLAVVLLLGRLAEPELWRAAAASCLRCAAWRGELPSDALRAPDAFLDSAACTRIKMQEREECARMP